MSSPARCLNVFMSTRALNARKTACQLHLNGPTMPWIVSRRCLALGTTIEPARAVYTAQPSASDLITMHIAQRLAVQDVRKIGGRIAMGVWRRTRYMTGGIAQHDG